MARTTRVLSTRVAKTEARAIERAAKLDGATRNRWCRTVLADAAADALEAADGDDERNDAD